jgi:hypothetical protein
MELNGIGGGANGVLATAPAGSALSSRAQEVEKVRL